MSQKLTQKQLNLAIEGWHQFFYYFIRLKWIYAFRMLKTSIEMVNEELR